MSQYRYVTRVALTVAMGGFLMGFDASVISGVVKFIETQFDLSKIELGWAVSSLTLTATLAMMVSGPLSDRIGRRRVLFLAAILYGVSAIASALAPNFVILVIARMIGGLGVGASLIIAPMYIAEIAPPAVRGRMVSFNQLNLVVGISVAFFTNYLILRLGQSDAGWAQSLMFDEYNWRWMLGLETLPAVLYFCGLFFVPESPRWLLLEGRDEEARKILNQAVGEAEANKELDEIHASLAKDAGKEKVSVKELFAPAMQLVLTIGIVMLVLYQIRFNNGTKRDRYGLPALAELYPTSAPVITTTSSSPRWIASAVLLTVDCTMLPPQGVPTVWAWGAPIRFATARPGSP